MATNKLDIFKFPRTRHLFDAGGGAVSRDDLLMARDEEAAFYSKGRRTQLVALEEKVDGANLGISLGEDMRLRAQNRSHFVDSTTHRQFGGLDAWLEENAAALYVLLEPPGGSVLFGEWLYAKHSIHYTNLPGYFMAFDIYDCAEGKFVSRRERDRRLASSGIPTVRLIAETTLSGREDARKWLETASAFYDGPCEGIYLRIDGDMPGSEVMPGSKVIPGSEVTPSHRFCLQRSKVVRPDFLGGIEEQWTRQKLTKNIVVYDYSAAH